MIGARDMAFPRLNAFSYWMFLLGGIVLYSSFFAEGGPAKTGWTAYVPLSENQYAPGHGQDLWILSLHILADRRRSRARSTSSRRSTTCARPG